MATIKRGQTTEFFAVGDGRFDRKKINTYISEFGTHDKKDGREIFTAPLKRQLTQDFVRVSAPEPNRADGRSRSPVAAAKSRARNGCEGVARTIRSPGRIAAVCRVSSGRRALVQRSLRARRMADRRNNLLRFSISCSGLRWQECRNKAGCASSSKANAPMMRRRAISRDVLNGIRMFAQAGLNDPKVRHQLDDQTREAYIEMVHSADIARVDRGETKAVRLILEVTPEDLKAARFSTPVPAPAPQQPRRKNIRRPNERSRNDGRHIESQE